ncbi:EamA family transporter [Amycolatopsis jejuensis]|uniref:EamA family transporter n=1 Tax=Amycolatopsis jejuensis TaxID=330084 RepID=UPI0005261FE6|nr:EamA family transporter [Amycolatopsis jejuensis]
MAVRDRLLAVFVAVLWGLNFIAIHATLGQFPPMFAGALRFLLIAIPTIFLVPRPKVQLRYLLGYGLGFGTAQFAFLFVAMHLGMPTGLASLVLQAAAPFTVLLGAVLLRERVSGRQLTGILLAVAGMTAIAWQQSGHAALVPLLLTVLAALSWAFANLCMRRAEPDNPLRFTLWMSVVPPLPMLALSFTFEGPAAGWRSLTTLGTPTGLIGLAGLAYVVVIGTVVGSGIWSTLMRRNPAGVVAPFSLLVPVVGLTASFFVLGEVPTVLTLVASAVVIGGVLLGSLRPKPAAEVESGGDVVLLGR